MAKTDSEPSEVTKWDPGLTEKVIGLLRPLIKGYHRAEVRGLDNVPPGGVLVVSNHSGGLFAMDVPVFATDFYEKYGYDRPVYTLGFDLIFVGPTADFFKKTGFIPANHENADEALRTGGVVIVFPGGDYDVYRPTMSRNTIDFGGRTGYVRAALNAGVPIVPSVSIGGQEGQLYLSRGTAVAKALRLDKLLRAKILPISFGFPFGLERRATREPAAAHQDRHAGTASHRHRRGVRRGPRRRRGRRPRPARHAEGARRARQGTHAPGARLTMALTDRLTGTFGLVTTMVRAGVIAPLRPDKYVRIAAAMARENMSITSGFAAAAQRCPDRPGLVDELGTLTFRRARRARDALAAALQALARRPHPTSSGSWRATTADSSRR